MLSLISLMTDENKVKFFDKWLNKVMELKNKTGEVHFRRWKIFESNWFNIYIHQILKSDTDKHLHNHPWNFISFIIQSGYFETRPEGVRPCFGGVVVKKAREFHKIKLIPKSILGEDETECWTLVFTGKRINPDWGYLLHDINKKVGVVVNNETYRKMKSEGNFSSENYPEVKNIISLD